MLLDPDLYEHARQARDPALDGRVFIGVLTTGIYCRPVCPVRLPRRENILLYSSAAAAAEAGFRPCLRCRPESAPGTRAWLGTSSTHLSLALQRIAEGYLDDLRLEALAAELGISARQLSRLFRQHLGVTPAALARTQRLHFAKKLIDETDLSMSDVCFAAGFGSVRRFNAAIQDTWQRTPRDLRNARQRLRSFAPDGPARISLSLQYRPPFNWRAMLAFLDYRSIPGVERVSASSYARTLRIGDRMGMLQLHFDENQYAARLELTPALVPHLFQIAQRVRQMFDLNAMSAEIDAHLARDPLLAPIVARYPGTRVPVAWDGFEVGVRAILGQQITVRAATTLVSRLVERHGSPVESGGGEGLHQLFPEPSVLARATLEGLGIPAARAAAIRSLAELVCQGELRFDGSMSTAQFVERVVHIKGIGPWTAQYIALRALNDPDAFPDSDLILLRVVATEGEQQQGPMKPAALRERAEAWRPWRAYAVLNLWQYYALGAKDK